MSDTFAADTINWGYAICTPFVRVFPHKWGACKFLKLRVEIPK